MTIGAQRVMKGTCKVSRKVVLESWRREVGSTEVGDCKGQWEGEQRGREAVKRNILADQAPALPSPGSHEKDGI